MQYIEGEFISSFSHTGKIATFQILKNKIDKLTDRIDFGEFPSSESPFVVTSIQYVCYLYEEVKSGSSVNELRYS